MKSEKIEINGEQRGGQSPAPAQDGNSGQGLDWYINVAEYIKNKYRNAKIYIIRATNIPFLHRGDIIVETDDEVLYFSFHNKGWDELYNFSWTDSEQEYLEEISSENPAWISLVEEVE